MFCQNIYSKRPSARLRSCFFLTRVIIPFPLQQCSVIQRSFLYSVFTCGLSRSLIISLLPVFSNAQIVTDPGLDAAIRVAISQPIGTITAGQSVEHAHPQCGVPQHHQPRGHQRCTESFNAGPWRQLHLRHIAAFAADQSHHAPAQGQSDHESSIPCRARQNFPGWTQARIPFPTFPLSYRSASCAHLC